jgi:hypothetical protein
MRYGCCHLSIVPVRAINNDRAEMVTQLLFGDIFEILEKEPKWIKIKIAFDQYEGWIDSRQFIYITGEQYYNLKQKELFCLTDLVEYVQDKTEHLTTVLMGSSVEATSILGYTFVINSSNGDKERENIVRYALLYLNAPYLWGGKTPFGIDCSGFTQMVYKTCGFKLYRDAYQQAEQGITLSFIEEAKPGDLAFFDDEDGRIIHVGIIMENNYIIHAHGKVRIDRLDHSGIFNSDIRDYSHKLRLIKHIS